MTTRTGEPATKRESYTQYIQGRAAEVRRRPTPADSDSSLDRSPTLSRGASSVSYPSPPVVAFFAFAS